MRDPFHLLLLGGTTEARRLAETLKDVPGLRVTLSLAGRTENPAPQPVPARVGGFGGVEGLEAYLKAEGIGAVVDATHPYAARISAHAAAACGTAGVPLLALRRPAWARQAGDRWREMAAVPAAVAALKAQRPRRVFLALGRNEVRAFEAAPDHAYLVRSVDPIDPPLNVREAHYIVARGPFDEAGDGALLKAHRIDLIVSKNSGGAATYGKIAAARALGIPVMLMARPELPDVPAVSDMAAARAFVLARMEAARGNHDNPAERGE